MIINPNNLIGIGVLALSFVTIRKGFLYKDDPGPGKYITNIRLIGEGALFGIMGIALCFTSKSFCEVFSFFCYPDY